MDDRKRCRVRYGKWRIGRRRRQAPTGQGGLTFSELGEGRLHGALEPVLDDELRLTVAEQDEDRVEPGWN
jgi:hypothetical protein